MADMITLKAETVARDFSGNFGNSMIIGKILEGIKMETKRIAGWTDHP